VRGRRLEADVRVDPPLPGPPDGSALLERKAGRVGEEVTQRRPRRPGRVVKIDDALLERDERRERRVELGDGRKAKGPVDVPVRGDRP